MRGMAIQKMEAIIWLCIAGVAFFIKKLPGNQENKSELQSNQKRIYFATSVLLAIGFEMGIKSIFHINYISKLLFISYVFISSQISLMLLLWLEAPQYRRQLISIGLKLGFGLCVLGFYYYFLSHHVIGNNMISELIPPVNTGMATAVILLTTLLWLYGMNIIKRFPDLFRSMYCFFLALTPFLLFLIVEICWNPNVTSISIANGEINVLIYLLLEIIFINLFRDGLLGIQLLYIFSWALGALNYYLVEFRGQPLLPTDLHSLKTAASVASQYSFNIAEGLALTLLFLFPILIYIRELSKSGVVYVKNGKRNVVFRNVVGLGAIAVLCFWVGICDFTSSYHMNLDFWWQNNTYKANGFAPSFIAFLQKMKIDKPDGYTEKDVETLLNFYVDNKNEDANASAQENPTIITIMNESFSDLSVMGPLSCTENDLNFYHSLKNDPHTIEYGWNYVSTRGGGTSTTEFEYLTGDSMAFTNGINPYPVCDFTNVPTIVSFLKEQGYHTIALHPENPGNWRRSLVYPKMGFDEFYSISAFSDAERTVWNRVSDLGDYKKLIEVFEDQTEPSFIFNVTLQNHGGYDGIDELKPEELVEIDDEHSSYSDVQMYESLIAKSDQALEYLIHYFEQVDRPVIICFFGDHQPSLNSEFEDKLLEAGKQSDDTELSMRQKYYAVPYFIWSNYDIPEDYALTNATGESVISTNYLGVLVQKYAGLKLNSYGQYLLKQREEMPVFNFVGYMSKDGTWNETDKENSLQTWVNQYRKLQYYALFDKKRNQKYFQ